jgi:hypothetical protein
MIFVTLKIMRVPLKMMSMTLKMMSMTLKMMPMTFSLQVLCRWILSVKKNYRPVKYHNWRHALNVCQTMFTVLKTGKLDRFMTELEVCFIFSIFFSVFEFGSAQLASLCLI